MPHNLNGSQRAMYVLIGLGLAAAATRPRPNPLMNVLALASGGWLVWTGYRGYCPAKAALFDADVPRLSAGD